MVLNDESLGAFWVNIGAVWGLSGGFAVLGRPERLHDHAELLERGCHNIGVIRSQRGELEWGCSMYALRATLRGSRPATRRSSQGSRMGRPGSAQTRARA